MSTPSPDRAPDSAPGTDPDPATGRRLQRLARASIDRCADAIYWLDVDGRIVDANQTAADQQGTTRSALRDLPIAHVSVGLTSEKWTSLLQTLRQHGRVTAQSQHRDRTGREFPVSVRAHLIQDQEGEVVCAFVRDTTEEQAREEELARSRDAARRLAAVAETAGSLVMLADPDFRFEWVNDAFTAHTGWRREEIRGRRVADVLRCPDTCLQTVAEIDRAVAAGEGFDVTLLNATRAGRRYWADCSCRPLRDEQGTLTGFLSIERDVTERKVAEERLHLAIGAADAGLWDWTVADGTLVTSAKAHTMLGETPPPQPHNVAWFFERVHPEDAPALQAAIGRSLADPDQPSDASFRMRCADGQWKWIRSLGRVVERNPEGNPIRLVGLQIDISESKAAEDRLRESEERYGLAVRGSTDGMWDWNVVTGEGWISDRYAEIIGDDPDAELMDFQGWVDRVHPEDRDATLTRINATLEHGEPYRGTYRFRHADGSWRRIHTRASLVRDASGAPVRMVGFITDVTDAHQAREALAASREHLASVVESTGDGIIVTALDGRVTDANPAASRILGVEREDLLGQLVLRGEWDPVDEDEQPLAVHEEPLQDTLRSGATHRRRLMGIRVADGTRRWLQLTTTPLHDGAGRVRAAMASFSDVTEQRRAVAAAEDASRAKSSFLANMSHEIRTPMTAILGFADLLQDEMDGSGAAQAQMQVQALTTIRRNGEHLLRLINDILDLSKIEAGRLHCETIPTSPVAAIQDVAETLAPRAIESGLDFAVEWDGTVPETIPSDPLRLRQILMNLVGNALKFTEEGSVRIRVRHDAGPDGCGVLRVAVIDTGIGLSELDRQRLFRPFVQADTSTTRRFGGTGLGLQISASLARMLGGEIAVDSAPGEGSTFTLSVDAGPLGATPMIDPSTSCPLPSASAAADAARLEFHRATSEAAPASASDRSLDGCRVLLAEDGPDNQRLIGTLLRRAGATVTIVDDGRRAVEAMAGGDGTPPFDVVLMDMQMPVLDGYAATRRLRHAGHRLPILALTASVMAEDRRACLEAGCDAHLGKPIDRLALLREVASWSDPEDAERRRRARNRSAA